MPEGLPSGIFTCRFLEIMIKYREKKEDERMKAIKRMLTGLMLMLTAILAAVGDGSRGSWMGGAGVVLLLMALAMFVLGLFTKEEK